MHFNPLLRSLAFVGFGSLVALASFATGCGSTVVTDDSDGPPVNPPGCPASPPAEWDYCTAPNVVCAYAEGDCLMTYQCFAEEICSGTDVAVGVGVGGAGGFYDTSSSGSGGYAGTGGSGTTGGYGGYEGYGGDYGGCYQENLWQVAARTCSGAVDCDVATTGDGCANPGETCGYEGECTYTEKYCTDERTWLVTSNDDACCDYPWYCPSEPPTMGDACDPCFDATYCEYEIQTECGPLTISASCGTNVGNVWSVDQVDCLDGGG